MKLRTKRCGFSWSVFFRHFEHHKPSAILFQFIVEKAGISMADYVEKNICINMYLLFCELSFKHITIFFASSQIHF